MGNAATSKKGDPAENGKKARSTYFCLEILGSVYLSKSNKR
jgi:hypothetical protein